ncbi:hypothetical protein AOLI_G00181970 [Acnodon oligacanthus]
MKSRRSKHKSSLQKPADEVCEHGSSRAPCSVNLLVSHSLGILKRESRQGVTVTLQVHSSVLRTAINQQRELSQLNKRSF